MEGDYAPTTQKEKLPRNSYDEVLEDGVENHQPGAAKVPLTHHLSMKSETVWGAVGSFSSLISEAILCYKSACCLCGKDEPSPPTKMTSANAPSEPISTVTLKTTTIAVTAESLANARIKVAAEKKAAADEAITKKVEEDRKVAEIAAAETKKKDDAAAVVLKSKLEQERKKAAEDLKRLEKLQKKAAEKKKREVEQAKIKADEEALRKKLDDDKKAKKAANDAAAQKKRDEEVQMLKEMAAGKVAVQNTRRTVASVAASSSSSTVAAAVAVVERPLTASGGDEEGASLRAGEDAVHEEKRPCTHPSSPPNPKKSRPLSHKGVIMAEIKQLIVGKVGRTVKAKTGISQYKPLFQKQKEKVKETPKDPTLVSLLGGQLSRREQQYVGFVNKLDSPESPTSPTTPDPNSSYTVVSGSGAVSLLIASTVVEESEEDYTESSSSMMVDGGGTSSPIADSTIDSDRKSSHELAVEEAEWRDRAEQARMLVRRHHHYSSSSSLLVMFIIVTRHCHHSSSSSLLLILILILTSTS